jgi:hypothetical protein
VSKKDKYYLKKYGITEAEVQKMDEEQEGVCASCGKPYDKLHVEHDHKWKYVKIKLVFCSKFRFVAEAEYRNTTYSIAETTKLKAKQAVRRMLQRESVRGRCCWPCNRLIRFAYDDPVRLRKAAEYLERWNGKKQD